MNGCYCVVHTALTLDVKSTGRGSGIIMHVITELILLIHLSVVSPMVSRYSIPRQFLWSRDNFLL